MVQLCFNFSDSNPEVKLTVTSPQGTENTVNVTDEKKENTVNVTDENEQQGSKWFFRVESNLHLDMHVMLKRNVLFLTLLFNKQG